GDAQSDLDVLSVTKQIGRHRERVAAHHCLADPERAVAQSSTLWARATASGPLMDSTVHETPIRSGSITASLQICDHAPRAPCASASPAPRPSYSGAAFRCIRLFRMHRWLATDVDAGYTTVKFARRALHFSN